MASPSSDHVETFRAFNRFFTHRLGFLGDRVVQSPFSLTEGRIVFEIGSREGLTASDLTTDLRLDDGYVSRTLGKLEKRGLIERTRSEQDGRIRLLSLTEAGRQAHDLLVAHASAEVRELLDDLNAIEQARLTEAMRTITDILGPGSADGETFVLRQHEPGDMGWVMRQHALIYAHEYGWGASFEAAVGQICVDFLRNYDPRRERCWIAELHGEPVGSVFCVRNSDEVAQLRLLLVDPKARGLGLGSALVETCIRFARRTGYRQLMLWTVDALVAARRVYQKSGFVLSGEEPDDFGLGLMQQRWILNLEDRGA